LYGLPQSKLPKGEFEFGVGKDLPHDLPPNPAITKLLALVDELRQEGVLPTPQSASLTKTEAASGPRSLAASISWKIKLNGTPRAKKYVRHNKALQRYSPKLKSGNVKPDLKDFRT
jgi:hypothetical protein